MAKGDYKINVDVNVGVDRENEQIRLITRVGDMAPCAEIIDLKENAVRHALIKLGWTPPQQKPATLQQAFMFFRERVKILGREILNALFGEKK